MLRKRITAASFRQHNGHDKLDEELATTAVPISLKIKTSNHEEECIAVKDGITQRYGTHDTDRNVNG